MFLVQNKATQVLDFTWLQQSVYSETSKERNVKTPQIKKSKLRSQLQSCLGKIAYVANIREKKWDE